MRRARFSSSPICSLVIGLMVLLTPRPSSAQAVRFLPGFLTNVLPANDDGSTGSVATGLSLNFFGTTFTNLFVNNNGNVTFNSQFGTFTPQGLITVSQPIIAPFFADVDTRGAGQLLVHYGNDTVGGRNAFGVEWPSVGYFAARIDRLNTFELILIDRTDTGAGNFDIEMNYNSIQWETGEASGGVGGLGGTPAAAGYSGGTVASTFQFPGSLVNGALLNGGPNALVTNSLNSAVPGRYLFSVRNGIPVPVQSTSLLLMTMALLCGCALFGLGLRRSYR